MLERVIRTMFMTVKMTLTSIIRTKMMKQQLLSRKMSIHSARPKDDGRNIDKKGLPYLRPPVIIVGTHADCPVKEPKEMKAIIKKSTSGKTYDKHVSRPFITVNNTISGDKGVQKVRDKVNELFGTEPYMKEKIPVRWFKFEKVSAFGRKHYK
jgi:hypothetical protein